MRLTDFDSHHIEGFAREGGGVPFRVPLFSEIDGNLWSGGCPVGEAPEEFRFIVSLYPWEPYRIHDHQVFLQAKLYDQGEVPATPVLEALADYINAARAIDKTLVHCQAGLNRSGLLTGLALIRAGAAPADAIKLLRAKRCDQVLCNRAFEGWLLDYGKPKLDLSGVGA